MVWVHQSQERFLDQTCLCGTQRSSSNAILKGFRPGLPVAEIWPFACYCENKVLLESSHVHAFVYRHACFCAICRLRCDNRGPVTTKVKTCVIWPFTGVGCPLSPTAVSSPSQIPHLKGERPQITHTAIPTPGQGGSQAIRLL